jgi:uncharacterized protein (TIGR02996 family)
MNEERGFIRAILSAPNDAALRLIYADWLEERDDPRGEYLRLLCMLDGCSDEEERARQLGERLQELETKIDPLWVAQMRRGRVRNQSGRGAGAGAKRRDRRRRREALEADVTLFLRQYARKTKNTPDPNDRSYSREVERVVKRMRPEDLDQLMRGEEG